MTLKRTIVAALAACTLASPALAADHTDSPSVTNDPAADISDVYAWVSPDNTRVNLIMNIVATAAFSDQTQYVLHLESSAGFGMSGTETIILCRFDVAQTIECWAGDDVYVTGDASTTSGLANADESFRVFAGPRNDPFFFNISGFRNTIDAVRTAAPNLTFDSDGCPALDQATAQTLAGFLSTEPDGSPAVDDFSGRTVLSIAISIDRDLVDGGGNTLAVWGSTRR